MKINVLIIKSLIEWPAWSNKSWCVGSKQGMETTDAARNEEGVEPHWNCNYIKFNLF